MTNSVLEDLRELEQQQRDSQRKLANARLAKDHKLEQQTALEIRLETLKYANGELRTQLLQARELLSVGTRQLGHWRLEGDRFGDDIRALDRKLKNGLESVRIIAISRRKIDSRLNEAQKKRSVIVQLKERTENKLKEIERKRDEAKVHEQSLRQSIQQNKEESQRIAEEIIRLRAENKKLEQDLLSAQDMELSTQRRAEEVEAEIQSEKKRYEDAIASMNMKLEDCQKGKENLKKEAIYVEEELKTKTSELHQVWKEIIELQESEGHDPSPPPTDPEATAPVFDMDRLRESARQEDTYLQESHSERQALRAAIDQLKAETIKLEGETQIIAKKNESTKEIARKDQNIEDERRKNMDTFLKQLETEREVVDKLHQAYKELEATRAQDAAENARVLKEEQEGLELIGNDLAKAKTELEVQLVVTEELSRTFDQEKSAILQRMEEAKERAISVQKILEETIERAKRVEEEAKSKESETQNAQERIEENAKKHIDEANQQIELLLKSK